MTLETHIFEYIVKYKASKSLAIVEYFVDLGFTKQGIYKVLRKLKTGNKILWSRQKVEIHLLWVQQEIDRLAQVMPERDIVFATFDKSKKTYYAKTITELEQVYGQIFITLIPTMSNHTRNFYFYDVHNYSYINTTLIVDWYIDFIKKHHGTIYFLVGSTSPLDMTLKKKMKGLHMHCIDKKWNSNITIFGDYVFHLTTNKKIMKSIDAIFENKNEDEAGAEVEKLYQEKSLHKITVERNPTLARTYEKEFLKYFVIKD